MELSAIKSRDTFHPTGVLHFQASKVRFQRRMIYSWCKSFRAVAHGAPRPHCRVPPREFPETIRISFVPLSSSGYRRPSLERTFSSFFPARPLPFFSPPPHAEEFISVENFRFCSSLWRAFLRVIARPRGRRKRENRFQRKLWIFTDRARSDILEGAV